MELKHWMAAQNFDTDLIGNVNAVAAHLAMEPVKSAFWSDFFTVSGTHGVGWFGGQFEDGFAASRNAPAWCREVLEALDQPTRERLLAFLNDEEAELRASGDL
jgi:hypothetical protein